MAQKLAPAEKNSTDISAASAAFCISGKTPRSRLQSLQSSSASPGREGGGKIVATGRGAPEKACQRRFRHDRRTL